VTAAEEETEKEQYGNREERSEKEMEEEKE